MQAGEDSTVSERGVSCVHRAEGEIPILYERIERLGSQGEVEGVVGSKVRQEYAR